MRMTCLFYSVAANGATYSVLQKASCTSSVFWVWILQSQLENGSWRWMGVEGQFLSFVFSGFFYKMAMVLGSEANAWCRLSVLLNKQPALKGLCFLRFLCRIRHFQRDHSISWELSEMICSHVTTVNVCYGSHCVWEMACVCLCTSSENRSVTPPPSTAQRIPSEISQRFESGSCSAECLFDQKRNPYVASNQTLVSSNKNISFRAKKYIVPQPRILPCLPEVWCLVDIRWVPIQKNFQAVLFSSGLNDSKMTENSYCSPSILYRIQKDKHLYWAFTLIYRVLGSFRSCMLFIEPAHS